MGKGRDAVRGKEGNGSFRRSENGIVNDFINLGRDLKNQIFRGQEQNSPLITKKKSYQMKNLITTDEDNKISMVAIVEADQCVGCGICEGVCPEGAISVDEIAEVDREKCTGCGTCIDECPQEGISLVETK
ncbi:4Fe-4S binding protein [Candidatus Omnitrophota bacterium]